MKITLQTVGVTLAVYGSITFIALQLVVPALDRATAVQFTYGQLFQFMGTFSNEELDDAQVIATYHSKGHDYDQVLIRVLVEMRESQLAS
jgi:hypothetical protein